MRRNEEHKNVTGDFDMVVMRIGEDLGVPGAAPLEAVQAKPNLRVLHPEHPGVTALQRMVEFHGNPQVDVDYSGMDQEHPAVIAGVAAQKAMQVDMGENPGKYELPAEQASIHGEQYELFFNQLLEATGGLEGQQSAAA